jgi:hypothetical protein
LTVSLDKISPACNNVSRTLVFSDRIGRGLGKILCNNIPTSCVINHCMPDASFQQIIDNIKCTHIDEQTTIVLMLGDGSNVRYSDVKAEFDCLSKLGAKNVIIGALPYSASPCSSNSHVFNLNKLMYKLTSRHSDVIFFDTNNFISDYRFTTDRLAKSLASFIISVFGNHSSPPSLDRTTSPTVDLSLN